MWACLTWVGTGTMCRVLRLGLGSSLRGGPCVCALRFLPADMLPPPPALPPPLQFIWQVLTHIKNHYAINDWTTAGPRALTVVYEE